MEKKLHRIPDQAVVGGVAAGISQYLQIDVAIIRVIMVVMLFLPIPPNFGWTGLIYLVLWAALPTGPAINSSFEANKNPDFFKDKAQSEKTVMILGGALIFFGAIMLLDDFPIWYQIKRYIVPIALMATGAFLILRQRDKKQEEKHTIVTPPPTATTTPSPEVNSPFSDDIDVSNKTSHGIIEDEHTKDENKDDDPIINVN